MTNVEKWFKNRLNEVGYDEFKPQMDLITLPEYQYPELPLVAALGTSGGKTSLAIFKLEEFYRHPENANKKSIFFAAAKADTRDNVKEDLEALNVNFSYCVIDGDKKGKQLIEALKSDCQVIIVLPHTWNAVKNQIEKVLPKIDGWFVKDEAHKWYFNTTVQRILRNTKPAYQLLLTGTPYEFTAKKEHFNIYYCSVEELQEMGKCGDADVITVASSYDFRRSDYHGNGELKNDIKFNFDTDEKSLKKVLKTMVKVVGSKWNTNTWRKVSNLLGKLDRTIIYAKNRDQGNHFYQILNSLPELKDKVLYSDSKIDKNADIIKQFKRQEGHIFLIVVDRVMEGYSDDELFNIVDFKLSHKPSLLQQMLGRLFRISKHQPNKRKRYYKVVPRNEIGYVEQLMMGVVNLCTKEFYSKFDNNSSKLEVPIIKRKKKKKTTEPGPDNPRRRRPNLSILTAMEECGMYLNVDTMKSFVYKTNKEFELTKLMNLNLVKNSYLGVVEKWTFDKVKKEAKKYKNRWDFQQFGRKAYDAAISHNWLNDVCEHMEGNKPAGYWTKENVRKEAKKYKTKGEFFNNGGSAYNYALNNNWLDEFYPNQKRAKRKDPSFYTYDVCKKIASKYSKKGEFSKSEDKTYYYYSWKNKWLNDFFPKNNNNNFKLNK